MKNEIADEFKYLPKINKFPYKSRHPVNEDYIGLRFESPEYGWYEIVSYKGRKRIKIKFDRTGNVCSTTGMNIERGVVSEKRTVHGVANFDMDYNPYTENGDGSRSLCPFYARWKGMIRRCYDPDYCILHYSDCSVCKDWLTFSNFKRWMETQLWNFEGSALDKDLLVTGNREYSPQTCCFIPAYINCFIGNFGKSTYGYPAGVIVRRRVLKSGNLEKLSYKALYKRDGKSQTKTFRTIAEAHSYWQEYKIEEMKKVINTYCQEHFYNEIVHKALTLRLNKLILEQNLGLETRFI